MCASMICAFLHQLPGQLRRKKERVLMRIVRHYGEECPRSPIHQTKQLVSIVYFCTQQAPPSLLRRASPSMGHSVLYAAARPGLV